MANIDGSTMSSRRSKRTRCSTRQGLRSEGREVIIVDEFTGRLMPAAAGPTVCTSVEQGKRQDERENQTLATITFQNYFRMYKKLAGMTYSGNGSGEFQKITTSMSR